MKPRLSLVVPLLTLFVMAGAAVPSAAQPRIAFEERAVLVEGVAADGRLALSGAATGRDGYVRFLGNVAAIASNSYV